MMKTPSAVRSYSDRSDVEFFERMPEVPDSPAKAEDQRTMNDTANKPASKAQASRKEQAASKGQAARAADLSSPPQTGEQQSRLTPITTGSVDKIASLMGTEAEEVIQALQRFSIIDVGSQDKSYGIRADREGQMFIAIPIEGPKKRTYREKWIEGKTRLVERSVGL